MASLVLVGCGDDDDSAPATGDGGDTPADVVVTGSADLKFDKDSYTASAGDVVIELVNDGAVPHTLVFDDDSVDFDKLSVESDGDSDSGTAELTAGSYTVYCDIPGHRQAGMEAKIVVN